MKQKEGAMIDELIFGYIRGLDGKIPDCNLAVHANCFDKIRKNMLYNLDSMHDDASNGISVTIWDRLKSCCHHNLRDLGVHTDGAWWKLKKIFHP